MKPLPITTFTDAGGNPLSDGYVLLKLNTDAQANSFLQICAAATVRIDLDDNGTIMGSPTFWPNANLLPLGTVYLLSSYTEEGQQLSYNVPITVT